MALVNGWRRASIDVQGIDAEIARLDLPVPVKARIVSTARRLVLRLSPCADEARLSVPPGASVRTICRFLEERRGWLEERCAAAPGPIPFEDGADVPIAGLLHRVRHDRAHRGKANISDAAITVGGDRRHINRRVKDRLIELSRQHLWDSVEPLALQVDRRVESVSVRDARSRWGSCSASGRLSFSWRLILAPPEVLHYVAAHEVAHLVHLDHSPRFWSLVGELMPEFEDARHWLKHHGRELHRYGMRSGS